MLKSVTKSERQELLRAVRNYQAATNCMEASAALVSLASSREVTKSTNKSATHKLLIGRLIDES